jgi:hypothetical protein
MGNYECKEMLAGFNQGRRKFGITLTRAVTGPRRGTKLRIVVGN